MLRVFQNNKLFKIKWKTREYGAKYTGKITHQNSDCEEWGGAKRIEFTHDVLCKVAKERRDNRELQRREEEARAQQAILEEQLKVRRKRNVLMSLLVLFLCLLIAGTYWAFFMKQVAYYENIVFKNTKL